MIDTPLLRGRERWQRLVDGWIDATHEDAFSHTVRIADPGAALEVSAVALPSPTYEVRQARARVLDGDIEDSVLAGIQKLAGVGMVAGLGRRVAEATGGGRGGVLARDAMIEIARLARQVTRIPRERAERALGDALACWHLDTTGWSDLPDSCFTYSDAGRALFGTRRVATPMSPDLYSPRPGQSRVFCRKKIARFERTDDRLLLWHSMYDNVHGFEVTYEVDVPSGRILHAEVLTPRLPYSGICSEPQRKIAAVVGEHVDPGLVKRMQGHLGGSSGCAQLYDLTADLLRLLASEAGAPR